MSTPSSGAISWSQIQAVSGGAYSMSNFNAVSGRGYSASNYYNYSPSVCYTWYVYSSGWISYTDCFDNSYSDYFFSGEYLCAKSTSGYCYSVGNCEV